MIDLRQAVDIAAGAIYGGLGFKDWDDQRASIKYPYLEQALPLVAALHDAGLLKETP